jgi:ribosomal protein S12 methylthiotransferase accessory factor
VLRHVDTNGLAAGSTLLEAVVHGLCEVIERDALSILSFRAAFGDVDEKGMGCREIDLATLPESGRALVERICSDSMRVEMHLLPSDVGVPVFRSVIVDNDYPSAGSAPKVRRFVGLGASPNAALAAIRSLTEAVQSRVALVQGARDSFNRLSPAGQRPAAVQSTETEAAGLLSMDDIPTFAQDDLLADLASVLHSLRNAGFDRVIAIDLSRKSFGLRVVRIRVPGLSSFAVNRARVGWRCLRHLL